MKDYEEIRKRYLRGESQRQIAKAMHISRNTVAKYCAGGTVPWERKTPERNSVVLSAAVVAFIRDCLDEDTAQGLRKQQHRISQFFNSRAAIYCRSLKSVATVAS